MVNLANSRGLLLPESSRLFEQRFLDLCLSPTPDHPTYSAVCMTISNLFMWIIHMFVNCSDCNTFFLFQMIFIAITELNEEGGSCQEAISEFIKSKYESLPFAHASLLSHHLAKLVEKREILCDCNNYCYTLPGERKTGSSSTDAERKDVEVRNDQCAANEVLNVQNVNKSVEIWECGNHKVDLLEERGLTDSRASLKRKACGDINVTEVSEAGGKACLSVSTVKTCSKEGVAIEVEPEGALAKSGSEGRIKANSRGGEPREVVVLDEQNDVLIEESREGEENLRERNSEQGKAKVHRTSNRIKEACVEVKSVAYKTLWESQTEACSNIIALE